MKIIITVFSVLVSSAMSAVLRDGQQALVSQQKGGNLAYAIQEPRIGFIPAIFPTPEIDIQSEFVYFQVPRTHLPYPYKQQFSLPQKPLKIIELQELPVATSFEKILKLRKNPEIMDWERYEPMINSKISGNEERLSSNFGNRRVSFDGKLKNPKEIKKDDIMAHLFRQANYSQAMTEVDDVENLPETEVHEGVKEVSYKDNLSGDQSFGDIIPDPGNVNSAFVSDFYKELEDKYKEYGSSGGSQLGEFQDTMGRTPNGKDVPEAEGDHSDADEDGGLRVKSLESILKLIGGAGNSIWVKKTAAAPVRVQTTDYKTNFSEEMCSLWPDSLQWSAKAVRAALLVAQDMADVKNFAKSKFLGLQIDNITDAAKEASFHIVLAIDLRGAPVARAVRSAQKAVGAAISGSEAALRVATEYATSPGARFAQLVLKAAQRADDAAQIAKDILRNVNLND